MGRSCEWGASDKGRSGGENRKEEESGGNGEREAEIALCDFCLMASEISPLPGLARLALPEGRGTN